MEYIAVIAVASYRFRLKGGLLALLATTIASLPFVLVSSNYPYTYPDASSAFDYYENGLTLGAPLVGGATPSGVWTRFTETAVTLAIGGLVVLLSELIATQREQTIKVERKRLEDWQKFDGAKSDTLLTIAHQLKTPLTTLRISMELLHLRAKGGAQPSPENQQQLVEKAFFALENLDSNLNRLLAFFRLKNKQIALNPQLISVNELVDEAVQLVSPHITTKKQFLSREISTDLPHIFVDRDWMKVALVNLLENANRFTPNEGSIILMAKKSDGVVLIGVKDSGPGISPEKSAHIFEGYYQETDTHGSKAGLGLAVAKSIIDLHGGQIWLDSSCDKGASFYFTVPQTDVSMDTATLLKSQPELQASQSR